jgi:hypothetical protein
MKKLTMVAFVAGQVLTSAAPASAADLTNSREIRGGAFGGVQLRIPLGGAPRAERIRAGLTLAPTLQSRAQTGEVQTRIGEGLEFGYRSGRPVSLSLAGRDLRSRRLGAAQDDRDDRHRGLSTGEILLIAGGVIVVTAGVVAVVFIDAINDNSE